MTEFLNADTLTDSLSRLTGEEQKAVKMTAFNLQLNSANLGMSFHKPDRAREAVENAVLSFKVLDEHLETTGGYVSINTIHLAKGLKFHAVVVMACDEEVIPLQERIETVVEDSELAEMYNTERHLLYAACARTRDNLLVTSIDPASEFIDDLRM